MATREEDIQTLLDAAKRLPVEDRKQLIDRLLAELRDITLEPGESIVERTSGTIKNLDQETIRHLAEDDEFSGY